MRSRRRKTESYLQIGTTVCYIRRCSCSRAATASPLFSTKDQTLSHYKQAPSTPSRHRGRTCILYFLPITLVCACTHKHRDVHHTCLTLHHMQSTHRSRTRRSPADGRGRRSRRTNTACPPQPQTLRRFWARERCLCTRLCATVAARLVLLISQRRKRNLQRRKCHSMKCAMFDHSTCATYMKPPPLE